MLLHTCALLFWGYLGAVELKWEDYTLNLNLPRSTWMNWKFFLGICHSKPFQSCFLLLRYRSSWLSRLKVPEFLVFPYKLSSSLLSHGQFFLSLFKSHQCTVLKFYFLPLSLNSWLNTHMSWLPSHCIWWFCQIFHHWKTHLIIISAADISFLDAHYPLSKFICFRLFLYQHFTFRY